MFDVTSRVTYKNAQAGRGAPQVSSPHHRPLHPPHPLLHPPLLPQVGGVQEADADSGRLGAQVEPAQEVEQGEEAERAAQPAVLRRGASGRVEKVKFS